MKMKNLINYRGYIFIFFLFLFLIQYKMFSSYNNKYGRIIKGNDLYSLIQSQHPYWELYLITKKAKANKVKIYFNLLFLTFFLIWIYILFSNEIKDIKIGYILVIFLVSAFLLPLFKEALFSFLIAWDAVAIWFFPFLKKSFSFEKGGLKRKLWQSRK